MSATPPAALRVVVLAVADDERLADRLRSELVRLRTIVVAELDGASAVVALISPRSVGDASWRAGVEKAAGLRVVPLLVERVDDELVPDPLAQLNYTFWDATDVQKGIEQLYVALHTHLGRYRDARSLAAQAEAWIASGRNEDYLLDDVRRVRAFAKELTLHDDDGAATIDTVARQYLLASAHRVRRLRNRHARSFGLRFGVLVFAVIAVVGSVLGIATLRQRNVAAVALTALTASGSDVLAVETATLLLHAQTTKQAFPAVQLRMLAKAYGRHWDRAVVGGTAQSPVNAMVLVGSSVWGVDSKGRFDRWRMTAGLPFTTWQVTTGSLTALDGNSATAVASDGRSLFVLDLHRHAVRRITAPTVVVGLALAPAHRAVLVTGADGSLWRVPIDGGLALRLTTSTAVLGAVQRDDGTARALIRSASGLSVVTDTGATAARWSVESTADEQGALSRAGDGVVLIEDGTIRLATDGGQFVDTGRAAVRARALALLRGNLVVFATDAVGTRVYDPIGDVLLGAFCLKAPTVLDFVEGRNGDLLCRSAGFGVLDSVADAAPEHVLASAPVTDLRSAGTVSRISIEDGDLVRIQRRHVLTGSQTGLFDPTASSLTPGRRTVVENAPGFLANLSGPTAVAIAPGGDTAAVGFADGTVWEFDVDDDGRVEPDVVWTAPDHAAVTAIAWDASRIHLHVTTRSDLRWTAPSCAGCFDRATVFDRVRSRLPLCFLPTSIDAFDPDIRRKLSLTPCAMPTAG